MKFPNHIVLDFSAVNTAHSSQYWVQKYSFVNATEKFFFESVSFQRKFLLSKEKLMLNPIIRDQKRFTVFYDNFNLYANFNETTKNSYKILYSPRVKVKSKLLFSNHYGSEVFDYLANPTQQFNARFFQRLQKNFKFNANYGFFKANKSWNFFNVNFLRKEKIYTKLKYSRVPQYDIVSGGVAALFAGFLGFLICEKFGFELADSGDFYILFMYVVFTCFFLRFFLKITNNNSRDWNAFSFKWLFCFLRLIIVLLIKNIRTRRFF